MDRPQIVLEYESLGALRSAFESHLKNGGALVAPVPGLQMHDPCEAILVHPIDGSSKTLPSKVVMVVGEGESRLMGIAFDGFGAELRDAISAFVEQSDQSDDRSDNRRYQTEIERANVARYGDIAARMQLERRYGKLVWELLLRNPSLTKPEVVRIAQKGALPRPLLDVILSNPGWLTDAGVRRALLSNPKLTDTDITKVLRAAPRNDVKLLSKAGASPPKVRRAALQILKSC